MSHCHTLIQALHTRGYRMTPQREIIIEALAHANGHISAEEIFDHTKERTRAINLATVYRTLDLLVVHGMAARVDLLDGRVVYTTRQHGAHIHLVCRRCGSIVLAEHQLIAPLETAILTCCDFSPDLQHVSITGLCSKCHSAE